MNAAAVLVDGVARDSIAVTDRGLAFGDGIFRTMDIAAGQPRNWRWHCARLEADCATLGLAPPDRRLLLEEISRVAPGDATVKVVVTRGPATRGYAIAPDARPTRIVMAFPAATYSAAQREEGVRVRRCHLALSEQPRIAGAKTLNRLENVLARSEWSDRAIAEGLLGDAHGNVIGGTMSNVFVVKGGRVATPDLSRCGVVGAQRERIRELLQAEGIGCEVREVKWKELIAADEVFVSNSLIGVWPVNALDAQRWSVGPLTQRVRALVAANDARA